MNYPGFETRLADVDAQAKFQERTDALLAGVRSLHDENLDRTKKRTVAVGETAWESFQKDRDARIPETPPTVAEPGRVAPLRWIPPRFLGRMLSRFVTDDGRDDELSRLSEEELYDVTILLRVGLSRKREDNLFRLYHHHSREDRPDEDFLDWHGEYREAAFGCDLMMKVPTKADTDRYIHLENERIVMLGEKVLEMLAPGGAQEDLPVLTERQQRFRDMVLDRDPHDAITAASLCDAYSTRYGDAVVDDGFRDGVQPKLAAWGLRNEPKIGYFFPEGSAARRWAADRRRTTDG